MRMDNYICVSHPRIRLLITGELDPPLLSFKPYLDYMRDTTTDATYVFNHATADADIKRMRDNNLFDLADQCETILDNPPAYDGFRPCNAAVYHSLIASIKPEDLYITRNINYGDGVSLRNKLWNAMTGDSCKSKKLVAMDT